MYADRSKSLKRLTTTVLCCFLFIFCSAQTYNYKQFYKQSGLSSSDITSIVQDQQGFIWVGTENGVNRYDGYNFKSYLRVTSDSNSIANKQILSLFVDSKGELWIGTPYGLSLYNRDKDNFINYYTTPDSIILNSIRFFIEYKNQDFYAISTEGYIFKYNSKIRNFEFFQDIGQRCATMSFMNESGFWFGNERGLFYYSLNTYSLVSFENKYPQLKNFKNNNILSVFCEGNNLWIGTEADGIYRYSFTSDNLKYFDIRLQSIYFIKKDKLGNIWIGEDDGLYNYSKLTDNFIRIKFPDESATIKSKSTVSSMYEDIQGNFWLGIRYKGLGYLYKNKDFINYSISGNEPYTLTKEIVTAIMTDDSEDIWVGFFHSGINVINRKNSQKINFEYGAQYGNNLRKGSVFAFYQCSDKQIYVCMSQGGLQAYNTENHTFSDVKLNFPQIVNRSIDVRSIDEDKEGNLWLAIHGTGVAKYNRKTKETKLYTSISGNTSSLTNSWVIQVLVDSKNQKWVTAAHGLSRSIDDNNFKQYVHVPNDTCSLDNSFVNTVYEDTHGRIWVGTLEGLNLYIPQNDNFKNIKNNSFYQKSILSITEDNTGNLWIGTNDGLIKYDIDNNKAYEYNTDDGLISNEFMRNACYKGKSGNLYFGHSKGITCFNPLNIKQNEYLPPVYIVDIKLFNESYQKEIGQNIQSLKKVSFRYWQNVITFEYAALNYISPFKNEYAYKLEGFDSDWRYVGSKRDVTYTNLDPGKYRFHVKAANNDGKWNEIGYSIDLVIQPPFWKTLWFRLLAILIFGFALFGFFIWRTNVIRKRNIMLEHLIEKRTGEVSEKSLMLIEKTELLFSKNKQLNELIQIKDRFFALLGHDLRNPLSLIISFTEIIDQEKNKDTDPEFLSLVEKIKNISENTLELLENILQWGRSQSNVFSVNMQKLEIEQIIHDVLERFKEQALHKGVALVYKINSGKTYVSADLNMLLSVLRNLVSNAIKYTPEHGEISIFLTPDIKNNKVSIGIKDNGTGMTSQKLNSLFKIDDINSQPGTNGEKGSGFGLLLCHEYVVKMGGEIWAESKPGKGSTFYFTLQLFN